MYKVTIYESKPDSFTGILFKGNEKIFWCAGTTLEKVKETITNYFNN